MCKRCMYYVSLVCACAHACMREREICVGIDIELQAEAYICRKYEYRKRICVAKSIYRKRKHVSRDASVRCYGWSINCAVL